jgi:hypothetical protein
MINDIHGKGRTDRFILITPPPPRATKRPEARFAYRNAMLAVAKEAKLPILDIWALFLGKYDGSGVDFKLFESLTLEKDYDDKVVAKYLVDELHYSEAGDRLHWSGLHRLIRSLYPELAAGEGTDCFR